MRAGSEFAAMHIRCAGRGGQNVRHGLRAASEYGDGLHQARPADSALLGHVSALDGAARAAHPHTADRDHCWRPGFGVLGRRAARGRPPGQPEVPQAPRAARHLRRARPRHHLRRQAGARRRAHEESAQAWPHLHVAPWRH